jgi:outer membrane protein assembly factor BamB
VQQSSGWNHGGWQSENCVWEAEVGEGSTSPLVVGDRLYVMGWEGGGDHVRCLEANTGKPLWNVSYKCPRYGRYASGDEDAYSGPTSAPEYDPERGNLYTLSCDGDLNCWDAGAGGKKVWGVNLYEQFHAGQRPASNLEHDDLRDYGYTSAPHVHDDWVIVEAGSKDGSVMALDKRTGERRWASQYCGPAGHTGGLVPITVEGVPSLAVLTLHDLLVLRLDRGQEGKTVATYPWKTAWGNNDLTPAVQGDCVLISSWHTHKSICKVKITLDGAKRLWEQPYASFVGSPVVDGDQIYMANERLLCLDWDTGRLVWAGGIFGYGGACIATGDGKVIVWSNLGKVTLVAGARESPMEYKQLARVQRVVESGQAWSHPVLAEGRLFCKDRKGKVKCLNLLGPK